jgi:formylmethanofuran dehydrogenase subunit E
MGNVVAFKKPKTAKRCRASTLCRRGFHKWLVVDTPFDSKQGRLVTRYRCERCGEEMIEAHSR